MRKGGRRRRIDKVEEVKEERVSEGGSDKERVNEEGRERGGKMKERRTQEGNE